MGNSITTVLEPIIFIKEYFKDHKGQINAVDIGCGAGRYCLELYRNLDNLFLTCIDVSEPMLEEASKLLTQAGVTDYRTIMAKSEDIPLPESSADCLFTFNAIHHFDFSNFIAKSAQVVKSSGYIFIYSRWRSQNSRNVWGQYFPSFVEKETRLYELAELESMIKAVPSLDIECVHEFKFPRESSLDRLIHVAESSHYSTFSLYDEAEFNEALENFKRNIFKQYSNTNAINWFDENVMLVIKKQ